MRQERGLTLISLIFVLVVVAGVVFVGFKVASSYIDYFTVKSTLKNLLAEGANQSDDDLRASLDRRLDVNFIRDVTSRDLQISRDNGLLTLTVPIDRKQPLFGGISICVDLNATESAPIRQ
ncbi:MAG TPA: DUF4845 domain-containing protein [Parasulfuritortus sp.]